MSLRDQIQRRPVAAKPEVIDLLLGRRSRPYRVHGVNGVAATVTGSFSVTTPFLHLNYAANTSEWKAIGGDGTTPFPPDTVILDGRLANCPEEYWVLR